MRRLGKLVIMTDTEHASLMCRCEDAEAHAADFAADFERVYTDGMMREANRREERKRAFLAGKFHAAGGYAHALKETRLKLQGTTAVMCRFMDLAAKWRPLVEALESYPNQFVEIGFDAGMHFPVKRFNKDGTEYLATVQYQAAGALRELAHDDDVSDADAAADFDVVGTSVAAERRQP